MDNYVSIHLTVVTELTSNYGESSGNISTIQKQYKNGKPHAARSAESMKRAILDQANFYLDLVTDVNTVAQIHADEEVNAATHRANEGGYMNTKKDGFTVSRLSSIIVTPAISFTPYSAPLEFHHNKGLADNYAAAHGLNSQKDARETGLSIHNREFSKDLKYYSVVIEIKRIGVDEQFNQEASAEEKALRVKAILKAIHTLSPRVKGGIDNAEPIFIVGGISDRISPYFDNCIHVKNGALECNSTLIDKLNEGYQCGLLECGTLSNESEIREKLHPLSVNEFFRQLEEQVDQFYGVGGAAQ